MAEWVRCGLDPPRHFSFTYCLFVSVGVCVQAVAVHGEERTTCRSCSSSSLGGKQRPLNHLAASFSCMHQEGLLSPSMWPPRIIWLRITFKKLADLRNLTPGLLPKKAAKESKFYKINVVSYNPLFICNPRATRTKRVLWNIPNSYYIQATV